MKEIYDEVLSNVTDIPLSTSEITKLCYPDLDYSSLSNKIAYVYKTLKQLEEDGKVQQTVIVSENGRKTAFWSYERKNLTPTMSRIYSIITNEWTPTTDIVAKAYDGKVYEVLKQRTYNVLYRLERGQYIERQRMVLNGNYITAWRRTHD